MTYELHPLCTLFPRMSGADFAALRDDIKANGLRSAIVLHDGMILDGGNRYRACTEAGVEPKFTNFAGGNLVAFVLSVNLHRRHMTEGQQSAIVSSAQDWAQAQSVGKPKSGNVAGLATVAQRAAQSGASERTQRMADKVAKQSPELARKVAHGEMSLPKALAQVEGKKLKADPVPQPAPEDYGPSEEEIAASQQGIDDEFAAMRLVIDSDDRLATAMQIIKQRDAMIQKMEWRIRSLVNSESDLMGRLKKALAKIDRMEKAAA